MSLPRVLLVHNAYLQAGGEDAVVSSELALLRRKGHDVVELSRDNATIADLTRTQLAWETLWSGSTHAEALKLLRHHRPDVVHVHNTFPLVSPALYWACAEARVPVVQTVHNFRLACPQAMFLREGRVCENCLGKAPWPALAHGCYRESRAKTAVVVGMLMMHRGLRTYERKVTRYIALNEFCRGKLIQAGLPAPRVVIKPNFVDVARCDGRAERGGMLFVGRLAPEKGLGVLAEAWSRLPGIGLRVAGAGEESPDLSALRAREGVRLLGSRTQEQVLHEMRSATALVLPSIWYEAFPRTLVEAFGAGLPVIASRIGALAELVEDGVTGLLFKPGDAEDLAAKVRWATEHPDAMTAMGARARTRYEALYTADINHKQLLAIYHAAMEDPSHKDE